MPDPSGVERIALKVFISYSRKDEAFAHDLLAGLDVGGVEAYLDQHDIAAGEDWEARLARLIETADTVVFLISPDSIASPRCAWEVERTHDLKKRLLPVVYRSVDEALVPPRLKQLNYIFFDRPHSFGTALKSLVQALKTDIAWIREHTRIGDTALRWDGRGRADALLLRGDELAIAKDWLKAQPKYAPEPTLLMLEFIKSAEVDEAARANHERQHLDEMSAAIARESAAQAEREQAIARERTALRRGQRALVGAGALFASLVVGVVGWYNQAYLKGAIHLAHRDEAVCADGRE